MKIRRKFLSFGLLLLIPAITMFYFSLQLLQLSIAHSRGYTLMEQIRIDQSNGFQELLDSVDAMHRRGILSGVYSDFRARAGSMVYARTTPNPIIDLETLVDWYRRAILYRPHDGYLWAMLALHNMSLEGNSQETGEALGYARIQGKNDHKTLKILAHITIRDWPKFNCSQKIKMFEMLARAGAKDDLILNQWSADNSDMRLALYIDSIARDYNFSPKWAEVQVRMCQQESN